MGPRLPYPHRLQLLAARLSKACQLARRAGLKITDGSYGGSLLGHVCPVGALYWLEDEPIAPGPNMFDGEDYFVNGFDGCDLNEDEGDTAEYRLGLEFRKRFIEKSP